MIMLITNDDDNHVDLAMVDDDSHDHDDYDGRNNTIARWCNYEKYYIRYFDILKMMTGGWTE